MLSHSNTLCTNLPPYSYVIARALQMQWARKVSNFNFEASHRFHSNSILFFILKLRQVHLVRATRLHYCKILIAWQFFFLSRAIAISSTLLCWYPVHSCVAPLPSQVPCHARILVPVHSCVVPLPSHTLPCSYPGSCAFLCDYYCIASLESKNFPGSCM